MTPCKPGPDEVNRLELRTDGCMVNGTLISDSTTVQNLVENVDTNSSAESEYQHDGFIELYHISYFYLGVIGCWTTYLIGISVAIIRYKFFVKNYQRPIEATLHPWFRMTGGPKDNYEVNDSYKDE